MSLSLQKSSLRVSASSTDTSVSSASVEVSLHSSPVPASTSTSSSTSTSTSASTQDDFKLIQVLPKHVVDRIAAGEVVQRWLNVVKELLENSLDAGANEITITANQQPGNGIQSLTISDNGCGIRAKELSLAVRRHATSKLHTTGDFDTLQTFGFRGEALASIRLVAKNLTITSRTPDSNMAYTQSFTENDSQKAAGRPCARKVGTTILVEDLFYNLPHRKQKATRNNSEDYHLCLAVAQHYAIHYASKGVGIVMETNQRKRNNNMMDLNTGSLSSVKNVRNQLRASEAQFPEVTPGTHLQPSPQQATATKEAIVHVYGSHLRPILEPFGFASQSTEPHGSVDTSGDAAASSASSEATIETTSPKGQAEMLYNCKNFDRNPIHKNSPCRYSAWGLLSTSSKSPIASSTAKKGAIRQQQRRKGGTQLILFVNHRLVESSTLKRTIEDVYNEYQGGGTAGSGLASRPFVYLSLLVPPDQVDVNVHPSKQQVTLLYLDEICQRLASELRVFLSKQKQAFDVQTSVPTASVINPYRTAKPGKPVAPSREGKRKLYEEAQRPGVGGNDKCNDAKSDKSCPDAESTTSAFISGVPREKKRAPPNRLVRTNPGSQVGAIEPFLVLTQPQSSQDASPSTLSEQESSSSSSQRKLRSEPDSPNSSLAPPISHEDSCPLSHTQSSGTPVSVDMSVPGAFARLASACTCSSAAKASQTSETSDIVLRLPRQAVSRPRKVYATECSYTSICQLRKRITSHASKTWQSKLRSACFVGIVSQHRSLVQCGEDLVLINHVQCAKELFYQLSLLRFAGTSRASLGTKGIDVKQVIAQSLQCEDWLQESKLAATSLTPETQRDHDNVMPKGHGYSDDMLPVSETNTTLADQAAACLLQNAEMLNEYFSIAIERCSETGAILLKALPILLDGFSPSPHGLPLFLLRLATEVDWTEERPCFHGVCSELGSYYSQIPDDDEVGPHVRHAIFPAISTLLVPSEKMERDGSTFCSLTGLSKLYKIFERC